MLGEYNTPERFWSEAVNTACHAINRLYLHRFLKKTSYELLTGNKPNVSYFRVFGSKCYILVKKRRHSKFAPKAVEGFLLGYDSNTKVYKVFNKTLRLVEFYSDIVFDETNGSPREQADLDDVDEDEVPTVAIRTMAIGDVRPQEPQEQDQPSSSVLVQPPTQDDEQVPQGERQDQGGAHEEQDKEEEASQVLPPQVWTMIQRNHPVDQILGDISKGVTTRSRLAKFCEHYSFVSSIEPFKVEEALQDPDWVLAMQEELNNFKENEVWSLVPRPKQNVVGTKWVFRNKQVEHSVVTRNKARLVAKGYAQVKKQGSTCGKRLCPSHMFVFYKSFFLYCLLSRIFNTFTQFRDVENTIYSISRGPGVVDVRASQPIVVCVAHGGSTSYVRGSHGRIR
jgi:hypothetical protein